MANQRQVHLKGDGVTSEDTVAQAAITPGQLVLQTGALAGAAAESRSYALERAEMGKDMDTAYASGDTMKVLNAYPSSEVNAFLASGQNVAVGAALEAGANGILVAQSSGTTIAIALEALNLTGDQSAATGPSNSTRVRVRVY